MPFSLKEQSGNCTACPRRCGANRLAGEFGACGVGAEVLLAHAGLHFGEEPPISGTRGSGTLFFAGCNLHCLFCQNWQISQELNPSGLRKLSPKQLADEMLALQSAGAHNINLVSPSHLTLQIAEALRVARGAGLTLPVVYNSNGYDSAEALCAMRGLVDIFLPDLKYLSGTAGRDFSAVPDYAEVACAALREMFRQVGLLTTDSEGIAAQGLLVRHLVLPGQLENSKACLRFLAELHPQLTVSIMAQYSPQYRAIGHPHLGRKLSEAEYDEITEFALSLGLDNAYIQEMESQQTYLPDFDRPAPFSGWRKRPLVFSADKGASASSGAMPPPCPARGTGRP
jgi:putative pyruvate formate lyase activating enzyme